MFHELPPSDWYCEGILIHPVDCENTSEGIWSFDVGSDANIKLSSMCLSTMKYFFLGFSPFLNLNGENRNS